MALGSKVLPVANPDTGWKPLEFGHLQRLLTESDRLISIQAAAV
jgi:hypothetical protein